MNLAEITEEQKEALHIADVSESFLTFETEYGGTLEISKLTESTGFEVNNEETMFLDKEQLMFMIKWLA